MIICSQSSKLSSMGICSYIYFIKALESKEKLMILGLYSLFKLVWLLSKKIKCYQAHHLFHFCLAVRPARSQVVLLSKKGLLANNLSHWPPLYFSFNGWPFFQPRVSARNPLQQLAYTPTILIHSAILTSLTRRMLLSTWKFVQ